MAALLGTLHNPLAVAVLDRLERDADAIARRMALAARAEVEEYAAVRDPAFAKEVLAHAAEHVTAFVRSGRLGRPPAGGELDFVRERGARRARELMPLEALLETYLIGQRTVWEAIVEAAGDSPEGMQTAQQLTALTFAYTHAINVAVADAYLRESMALASEAERGRRDLLDRLLSGRELGPEETRRAQALGLRPDAEHVVVVALADSDEQDAASRLIVRALVSAEPQRPFVVARHDEVVAVMPVYVRRGPLELRGALERAAASLRRTHGVSMRAGVSSVCTGLSELARGYGEAGRAALHATNGAAVVALQEIALFDYLASSADETARQLVPDEARRLLDADRRQAGALSATLRAYADCDLNVARAAERLVVHPNTVHYRLRRVAELTGREPRRFADLVELLTALRLLDS
jgi:DNA-binding PucR family transcriptional regulator